INTFYSNAYHVGMTNLYVMLHEEPELVKYISGLVLEQNIEIIRMFASADIDAIFIDDATATCDMISRGMYEEFSLPYLIPQVNEIKRLGKKAMLTYFGGIADRADLIADTGADILTMECSMKGYVNDYAAVSKKIKGMCLAGNLNPYDHIEIASDELLAEKINGMVAAGAEYGKYFTSTGSPLTPNTPVSRIQRYIELARAPRDKQA
ncbi:MAG: uroporphyrinogen decarboxylase family protein, partial [Defluviitaleaceae bacterium]|nr:uroporphyrinogen decarboxylase family protein [Defluviitaleaceae bacterium]